MNNKDKLKGKGKKIFVKQMFDDISHGYDSFNHISTFYIDKYWRRKFITKLNLKNNQIFSNIHKYGNTTAASIPIALAEAVNENKVSNGDLVVFASFGSGFTWASSIIKW